MILNKNKVKVLNLINNESNVIEPNNAPRIILYTFIFLFNMSDDTNKIMKSKIKLVINIKSKYTFILITNISID